MKLQYLIVIFVAIMLPIVLILAQYVGVQVDTISTKTKYDTALLGATFDTMSAYELNTRNISNSSVVGADIREIEAVISTFTRSLSSSLGLTGVANDYILSYIPAIAFCMYDGYYIYMPNESTNGSEKLQPYVYYTKTYENGANTKITIAYSLDNYVTIYGKYSGKNISAAGYLIVPEDVTISNFSYVTSVKTKDKRIQGENEVTDSEVGNIEYKVLSGEVIYKGIKIEKETVYENKTSSVSKEIFKDKSEASTESMLYYYQAKQFTELYNEVIDSLSENDRGILKISRANDPDDENSYFMNEKVNVIKDSLTANLNRAICNFKGVNEDNYEMPQLTTTDWIKITNDISIVAFMQDIPLGNITTYNNYVVVNSTITKKFTNAKSIDFIGYDTNLKSKGYYHKITCVDFLESIDKGDVTKIIGYPSADFERFKAAAKEESDFYYYYKHNEYADYDCEVESIEKVNVATIKDYLNNIETISDVTRQKVLKAYYEAIGRIRFRLNKASSYINLNNEEQKFKVTYNLIDSDLGATGSWIFSDTNADTNSLWEPENWKNKDYTLDNVSSNSNKTVFQARYQHIELVKEIPYAIGYQFIGWKVIGNNSTGEWAKPGDILYCGHNNQVTLEAKYGNQYTITYRDDAKGTKPLTIFNQETKIQDIDLEIKKGVPSHIGFTFSGWRIERITDENGNDVTPIHVHGGKYDNYKVGGTIDYEDIVKGVDIESNYNIEFIAEYGEKTFDITYRESDGMTPITVPTTAPIQVQEGQSTGALPSVSKTGYTFVGWKYKGITYSAGNSIPANQIQSNLTLIAQWTPIRYTVTFNLNGGTPSSGNFNTRELYIGQIIQGRESRIIPYPEPTRLNYAFMGWSVNPTQYVEDPFESGDYYQFDADLIEKYYGSNTNLTLYAIWASDTWKITYAANASGVSNLPSATTGGYYETSYKIQIPQQKPTRAGYTFRYWTTNADGTGELFKPGETYTYTSRPDSKTVYAHWSRTTVNIIYKNCNLNGDIIASKAIPYDTQSSKSKLLLYAHSSDEIKDIFKREGEREGWKVVSWLVEGTSNRISAGQPIGIPENVDDIGVIAVWAPGSYEDAFSISFNNNLPQNSTEVITGMPGAQSGVPGQNITISTLRPGRNGYTFLGWSTNKAASSQDTNFDPGKTYKVPIDNDRTGITLYAIWKKN